MGKQVWTGMTCAFVFAVVQACGCNNTPGGGVGGGTSAEVDVSFDLDGGLGEFEVQAGQVVEKRGNGSFTLIGLTAGSGSIGIDVSDITVTPTDATGEKGTLTQQANSILEISGFLEASDLIDTVCEQPIERLYGPYLVTLDENFVPVSVDPATVDLRDDTIALLNEGEFTICIRVLSPVDATVSIASFGFTLRSD